VIRDEKGGSFVAQAKVFPFLVDPFMAEALGAWYAVKLGCDMGLTHVQIEGDSLFVVEALKKD
jgi:hypothetical protein